MKYSVESRFCKYISNGGSVIKSSSDGENRKAITRNMPKTEHLKLTAKTENFTLSNVYETSSNKSIRFFYFLLCIHFLGLLI